MVRKAIKKPTKAKAAPKKTAKPKLLSGGNPQIAKGYGDAPVQAYIAAVPAGWRRDVCVRLDAIITKAKPMAAKIPAKRAMSKGLCAAAVPLPFALCTLLSTLVSSLLSWPCANF